VRQELSVGCDPKSCLLRAANAANEQVRCLGQAEPLATGASTTLSALVMVDGAGYVAHVGDSRIYRYRNRRLEQLTADHTLGRELVKRRHIRAKALPNHPLRNVLARALGVEGPVDPGIEKVGVEEGDIFLLATDGFTDVATRSLIRGVLEDGADKSARRLVADLARISAGATDDLTVAVVKEGRVRWRNKSGRAAG
jgi:protein phosphatase